MTTPHAATRRELLIASGTLFAWAYLPKLARAEGRDPRLLVIVLRGALDGLAAVAPVGDPDWPALRGNNALTLDGKPAALPLDSFFALNPAMPNLHRLYTSGAAAIVHAAATPYRERSHFDGQDVLESGLPKPGAADSGWLNRALASLQPAPGAGPLMDAAATAPGERRHGDAADRTLSPYGSSPRPRAGGAHGSCDHRTRRGHGRRAAAPPCGRAAARLFRGIGRYGGEVSGASGRAPHRRARLRRLGHPFRRRRGERATCNFAERARWRGCRNRDGNERRLARNGRRDHHRVRPHGAHQRHPRHRPRHRNATVARRRRAQRRARHRRLARAEPGQAP